MLDILFPSDHIRKFVDQRYTYVMGPELLNY